MTKVLDMKKEVNTIKVSKLIQTCPANHGEYKRIRNYLSKDNMVFAGHWVDDKWVIPYVRKSKFAKLSQLEKELVAKEASYGIRIYCRPSGGLRGIADSITSWWIRWASKKTVE